MNHEDPAISRPETVIVTVRPGLDITRSCLRVGSRHFELNNLQELEMQQSQHDHLTRHSAMLTFAGVVIVVVTARYMHPPGLIAASLVLLCLAMFTVVSASRRSRRMELWAHYRGRPTMLFASDDWWLFTALERQLRRSLTESRLGFVPLPPRKPTSSVPHPSALHPSKIHPAS